MNEDAILVWITWWVELGMVKILYRRNEGKNGESSIAMLAKICARISCWKENNNLVGKGHDKLVGNEGTETVWWK